MKNLETLRFELKAAREVLKSQEMIVESYRRMTVTEKTKINRKSQQSVVGEYETRHIPRTKRMIEALEWVIPIAEERF